VNAEIETYSKYIREQIARINASLQGLSDAQRPPVEGANSVYVIATHVFGNARAWVLGVACAQPLHRDRPAEFVARGSYEALGEAAGQLSGDVEAALAALRAEMLDHRLVPSQELWGEGEPHEIAVRESLAHVLEHASMHLGQIQLTRDLAVAGERV